MKDYSTEPVSREELIKQCRYYKGEVESPFDDWKKSWYWDMERVYVSSGGMFEGEEAYYIAHNFDTFDNKLPFNLLVVMFTSWGKTEYDIPGDIGSFYAIIKEYLNA